MLANGINSSNQLSKTVFRIRASRADWTLLTNLQSHWLTQRNSIPKEQISNKITWFQANSSKVEESLCHTKTQPGATQGNFRLGRCNHEVGSERCLMPRPIVSNNTLRMDSIIKDKWNHSSPHLIRWTRKVSASTEINFRWNVPWISPVMFKKTIRWQSSL